MSEVSDEQTNVRAHIFHGSADMLSIRSLSGTYPDLPTHTHTPILYANNRYHKSVSQCYFLICLLLGYRYIKDNKKKSARC